MSPTATLMPNELVAERPFTNPAHILQIQSSLRYMAAQLSILLDHPHLSSQPPHVIFFNQPDNNNEWFHRVIIVQPDELRMQRPLTIVGFFGQKRADGNIDAALINDFDRTLVAEIPEHPGLLSYSTMTLDGNDYANLVVFSNPTARDNWSRSKAHDQAVQQLSPDYYHTVTIINGRLPKGL